MTPIKRRSLRLLYFLVTGLLVAAWCLCMVAMSAKPGKSSNELSTEVTDVVARVLYPDATPTRADDRFAALHHAVRKLAHFLEYALLAGLVSLFLAPMPLRLRGKILLILGFCLLFAIGDEVHQSFVTARTPAVLDVLIDFFGATAGCLAALLLRKLALLTACRGALWRRLRGSGDKP